MSEPYIRTTLDENRAMIELLSLAPGRWRFQGGADWFRIEGPPLREQNAREIQLCMVLAGRGWRSWHGGTYVRKCDGFVDS